MTVGVRAHVVECWQWFAVMGLNKGFCVSCPTFGPRRREGGHDRPSDGSLTGEAPLGWVQEAGAQDAVLAG